MNEWMDGCEWMDGRMDENGHSSVQRSDPHSGVGAIKET